MKREIRYSEEMRTVIPTVAKRILAAGILNEYEYEVSKLQDLAASEATDYLSYEIKRANQRVSCTLYARLDCPSRKELIDSEGNEWYAYEASFDVSWPSHGTTALAQAAARVELYAEAVKLATRLQAEFGDRPLMHLSRTKAQIDEHAANAAKRRAQAAAEALVKDGMTYNLRVGNWSQQRKLERNQIPLGDYQIAIAERRYTLVVREDSIGEIFAKCARNEDATT